VISLPLTGGCGCGAVRFEIDAPLVAAGYCHCTRCQRRSGTAAGISGMIVPGSLRIVTGEEHLAAWKPGSGMDKVFCSKCGSGLWAAKPDGEPIAVRLGAIDGDPGVEPSYHQWVDSAVSWEPIPDDGLPRYPGLRSA
jgi:hypothetical protein